MDYERSAAQSHLEPMRNSDIDFPLGKSKTYPEKKHRPIDNDSLLGTDNYADDKEIQKLRERMNFETESPDFGYRAPTYPLTNAEP